MIRIPRNQNWVLHNYFSYVKVSLLTQQTKQTISHSLSGDVEVEYIPVGWNLPCGQVFDLERQVTFSRN